MVSERGELVAAVVHLSCLSTSSLTHPEDQAYQRALNVYLIFNWRNESNNILAVLPRPLMELIGALIERSAFT